MTLRSVFIALSLLFSGLTFAQNNPSATISADDLTMIVGEWEGSLTYLDYQSGKPYTMPANLKIEAGKNENQLSLFNSYPDEPKANNRDKIILKKQGTVLNKSTVSSRKQLPNGDIQITTEKAGKDDNKKALIRYTYLLGKHLFQIRKEVQFDDASTWIKRSEFNYERKK